MAKAAKKTSFQDVERARRAFSETLGKFRAQKGKYHNPAPELPDHVLAGCTVLPSRLALFEALPRAASIAKVGLTQGTFTLELIKRAYPEKLHLIFENEAAFSAPELRQAVAAPDGVLRAHPGPVQEGLAALRDGSLDVIYLDHDQSYEGATQQIAAAVPKLAPEGALLLSNYAVWSAGSMFHCGVARAVHELCLSGPWRFHHLVLHPMMYYDVLITRDPV